MTRSNAGRSAALLPLAAALVVGLTACGSSRAAGGNAPAPAGGTSSSTTVTVENFAFTPKTLTVKSGATVTWKFRDAVPHNVKAGDGSFASANLGKGKSYSFTFTAAGTFNYVCTIHPGMAGTVVVR